jgi:excisionase family DNA binding protein
MSTSTLMSFDRELCEYALGQVRSHLLAFPRERTPAAVLHPADFDHLTLPAWVAWAVTSLPTKLGDRIWAGVGAELPGEWLSADELYDLSAAFDDPPVRLESEAVWLPCERTHARYVTCLPVIRHQLGGPVADEWASSSLAFAAHLTRPLLPLAEGFGVVCDFTRRLRQLARTVGEAEAVGGQPQATEAIPKASDRVQPLAGADYLTPAEVAATYRVSLSAVYAACKTGQLAHHRVSTKPGTRGKYLIRATDLQAWLNAQRVARQDITTSASAPASSAPPAEPASPFAELDPARLVRAWRG